MTACIVGWAHTAFGRLDGETVESLVTTVARAALAERLMTLIWPSAVSLRFLLTGADTLRHYPPSNLPFTLVNNYGPTECTVVATSGPGTPAA